MNETNKEQHQRLAKNTDINYWNELWLNSKIGFNRLSVNKHFKKHILSKIISIDQQQCVLFPLCGKTVDMKAVLDINHQVIGIEYIQLGIEAFFEENNIEHDITNDEHNKYSIYKGINRPVTIYCMDFFTFDQSLPTIDWIWDRGGFVAINISERKQYRDILLQLMTPGHTQLYLLTNYYKDSSFSGPPHCVSDDDIIHLFGSTCSIQLIEVLNTTAEFNLHYNQKLRFMEEHLHLIIRK
ncbi:unnamed protein product [Adineta steineri]|uniref:thiopurine S-methyltransferase n=2 Tax=Adineta steineri TaxID=433720 RepID=A0A819H518_9BILA|nr:unnamed protein product [Adineta steineri]CAF1215095.1 unnamed protein product [Adineta steineri]CAF3892361.1 unnamed protein product [Adineta steineri]